MTHTTARRALCCLLLTTLTAAAWPAQAATPEDSEDAPAPTQFLELGLNLRTDLGVHPLRIDLGWRMPHLEALLVLDPMFWTDGQSSTDLSFHWLTEPGVQPFAGWRLTTIGLPEGTQMQQNLLLGCGLALPEFFGGKLRGQWGMELAMTVAKHGGGLPSEVLSFASARHYLDLVNFAMFARFDFNLGMF